MSASKRGPTIQIPADRMDRLPVGTWWTEYYGKVDHCLGDLTPDIDMLRYSYRYALCGYGPFDTSRYGGRADGYVSIRDQPRCQKCERMNQRRLQKEKGS